MIYTTTKDQVIFASKHSSVIEALRHILQHEHIGYEIGFSCEGTTICCNRKQEQNIKKKLKQWHEAVLVIDGAIS